MSAKPRGPVVTYAIAHAAGTDAGNASMKAAGRTSWNKDDFAAAGVRMDELLRMHPQSELWFPDKK